MNCNTARIYQSIYSLNNSTFLFPGLMYFLYETIYRPIFTYYYMMSANWVSVKITVPSECNIVSHLDLHLTQEECSSL